MFHIPSRWKESGGGALYRKLYTLLREEILCGRLITGQRLPASRQLAKDLAVSRNTVVQAFDLLIADGFVTSRQGDGMYVSDDLKDDDLIALTREQVRETEVPSVNKRAQNWLHNARLSPGRHQEGPFGAGRTALEEFPFDLWARLLSRQWRLKGKTLAMEGSALGYEPLRRQLALHLRETRGVQCQSDQIMIVSGAQQGLDLLGRILWETGDRVVLENPAFGGINGVIEGAGAEITPVDVDAEGLRLDDLKDVQNIKSFLVTPSRNYPLGVTMSLARRLALLQKAREQAAWVIEDDFDCDFRFDGPPLSSLHGLDTDGRVIYVGTFSRILFPALRLGFVVLPTGLINAAKIAKTYIDGHASIVHQAALAAFFEDGYFASHLRRMKKLYQQRRQYLIERIESELSHVFEIQPADGGLHICVTFKDQRDDKQISELLTQQGIQAKALSGFYRGSHSQTGLVLGFAGYNEEVLANAFEKMTRVLSED